MYLYKIESVDRDGTRKQVGEIEVLVAIPQKYELYQNYPNPFNPLTTIKYEIPEDSHVTLKIYDITGKEIKKLVNENQNAGYYSVIFDASDLSSGVYFYKLIAGSFVSVKKMVVAK